jgi:cullin 3
MGRETSDFESHWTVLAASLREIHTKDASNLSFEELYRTTYQLMLHPPGSQLLHGRVVELEKNWLSNDVHPRVAASVTPNLLVLEETAAPDQVNEGRDAAERFLSQIREVWEDHQLCMGLITDVLMYMVRLLVTIPVGRFTGSEYLSYIYRRTGLLWPRNAGTRYTQWQWLCFVIMS